jgi:hypothetical protein
LREEIPAADQYTNRDRLRRLAGAAADGNTAVERELAIAMGAAAEKIEAADKLASPGVR